MDRILASMNQPAPIGGIPLTPEQQFAQLQQQQQLLARGAVGAAGTAPKSRTFLYIVLGVVVVIVLGVGIYFIAKGLKKNSDGPVQRRVPSNVRLEVPPSWNTMPPELHAKAEESYRRIAAHYMSQGLPHKEAQTKAANDVEAYIRSIIAKRMSDHGAAGGEAGPTRPSSAPFSGVVKVNPSEVEGMVGQGPPSRARAGGPPDHDDDDDRTALMRPKQRAAMETARAAEILMNERHESGGGGPSEGHDGGPRGAPSMRSQSSSGSHEHDENFTPL